MTPQLLVLMWFAVSAAGLAATAWMLVHAWAADEPGCGPARPARHAFRASG